MIIVFVLILIVGCGKSDNDDGGQAFAPNINSLDPTVENFATQAKLFCDGDCPASMMMMFSSQTEDLPTGGVKVCNAAVIDDDIVLVPSSCFPNPTKVSLADACRANVVFKGANTSKFFRCGSILSERRGVSSADDPGLWREDYVVVRLTEVVPHRPVDLSSSGIELKEAIQLWSFKSISGSRFEATPYNCFAWESNFLIPGPITEFSSIIPVDSCGGKLPEILPGAFVWSKSTQEYLGHYVQTLPNKWKEDWKNYLAPKQNFPAMGFIVNAQCLPIETGSSASNKCFYNRLDASTLLRKRHELMGEAPNLGQVVEQVEAQALKGDQYVKFSASPGENISDLERKITLVPRCFQNSNSWLPSMRAGFFQVYKSNHKAYSNWPQWFVDFQIFDQLIIKGSLKLKPSAAFYYEFSPKDLQKKKKSWFRVYDSTGTNIIKEYSDVPLC